MTIMKYLFQFVFINYVELIVSHYTYMYIEKVKIIIMIISKALTHKTMIAIIIIIIFLWGSLAMQYGFLKPFQTGEVGINTR